MFKPEYKNLFQSGVLNSLVSDYLNKQENLKAFYNYFPDLEGFKEFLGKNPYEQFDRNNLKTILLNQSKSVVNTSEKSIQNIEKLSHPSSYTITTGHQLCLFTGPLYFIYKIFSVIQLADALKTSFPESEFIPVFWMASEDHDFEEVNHFHLFGKKVSWESKQTGAVGDFNPSELTEVFKQLKDTLGETQHAAKLLTLFENAYLNHKSLSDATRFLVNDLFGSEGLVIVDGHDKMFKSQFKDIFKTDAFENTPFTAVQNSTKELSALGYSIQVNPRPINSFYLEKGSRNRIESQNGQFGLVGGSKIFTNEQLVNAMEQQPENFSPNVVLRPMFQQRILPNIAYVGGPGELAYWLQFKAMFDKHKIQFPILMPRHFVLLVEKNILEKIQKLGFAIDDFFRPEMDLVNAFMTKSEAVFEMDQEEKELQNIYAKALEKVIAVDKTLAASVSAELQKAQNGLQTILAKANRSLKQKSDTELKQIKTIKQKLFPDNQPQERFDNFSYYYLKYGPDFLNNLKKHLQAFNLNQLVLVEN